MKKELYNRLIDEYKQLPHSSYKATWTDEIESHCFGYEFNRDLSEVKALFKEHGWKSNPTLNVKYTNLGSLGKTNNVYLTVLYDTAKDKISISLFEVGYAFSYRKQRYYPVRRNTPVFCWSKHMYMFSTRNGKTLPRIQMGTIGFGNFALHSYKATELFMNTTNKNSVNGISYRHHMNAKSSYEVLENYTGVKIPAVLKKSFETYNLLDLYKSIKDYNEINKVCQFIAANSDVVKEYMYDGKMISLPNLLSHMLFGDGTYSWLVSDSMRDCISLKERTLSLKVTSLKRWQDEHRKATARRMAKGISEIKVDKKYTNALDGLEYPYELISTKDRLIQESTELGHCVATYANKINSGDCGIFSVEYEGKRYTLEVKANQFDKGIAYVPIQFKGLYNCAVPDVLLKTVCDLLYKNSDTDASRQTIERSILGIQDLAPLF